MIAHQDLGRIAAEFEGLSVPDKRFNKNIQKMATQLAEAPGASFSAACGEALRKSAHRLFSHEELDLLSTHRARTEARTSAHATVLLVEDTTDLVYRQEGKEGMGPLGGRADGKTKGLNLHTLMALSLQGLPLGIVSHQLWAPSEQHKGKKRETIPIAQKESYKWIATTGVLNALAGSHPNTRFIKIGDREADFFEHYSQGREANAALLVRLSQKKRNVIYNQEPHKVGQLSDCLPVGGEGLLRLRRKGKTVARRVCYRHGTIELPPTSAHRPAPAQLLQVVSVTSIDNEAEALEWLLATTLPVMGVDDCVEVARCYALRWTIERYHYILKSGLGAERTQLQSARTIGYALELWAVVGWWVLLLYRLGQIAPEEPAATFFETDIIEVLEATALKKTSLSTVGNVVKAIGRLGGFRPTKKQPMPGEKMLWTGVRLLAAQMKAYQAAKERYGTG